jgi:hypothetical protein
MPSFENLHLYLAEISLNHHGEQLCGDSFQTFGSVEDLVMVLSDGLGSGVKANILSTLTTGILGTMIGHHIPIDECVDTMASTLPVDKEKKLAYATFTAAAYRESADELYLIEYDNPPTIFFRKGQPTRYPYSVRFVGDKEIHECHTKVQFGDVFILMSDGVTHSGIGKHNNFGWGTDEIKAWLLEQGSCDKSAEEICLDILTHCQELCDNSMDDDTSVAVLKFGHRRTVNLIIGPPKNPEDDKKVLDLFFGKKGKHVVCGGSTSNMVSRYLGKPIQVQFGSGNAEVPDMAVMEGVDLVTEGIITLEKVLEQLKTCLEDRMVLRDILQQSDPASLLTKMLILECSNVNFYVGMAANEAHANIGIAFEQKLKTVRDLEAILLKYQKKVRLSYC